MKAQRTQFDASRRLLGVFLCRIHKRGLESSKFPKVKPLLQFSVIKKMFYNFLTETDEKHQNKCGRGIEWRRHFSSAKSLLTETGRGMSTEHEKQTEFSHPSCYGGN